MPSPFLLALCIFSIASAKKHTCIHDDMHSTFPKLRHGERHVKQTKQAYHIGPDAPHRELQSSYSPIRITFDTSRLAPNAEPQYACYSAGQSYQPTIGTDCGARSRCAATDVLSDQQRTYLTGTVLPAALSFFTDTLSVIPVANNLVLSNPIPQSSCVSTAWGICNQFICCANNFPAADATNGVPNSDFHIYVTARPTAGSTIAWALTCQTDQYGRPTAGQINFGPGLVSTSPDQLPLQISTAIHELTHALGFSSSGFSTWLAPGTTRPAAYSNIVWGGTLNGNSVKAIITPRVAAAASAQFGCLSWTGMPAGGLLEDYGSSGTAGSHWKKRVFFNEYMTGTADPNSVYSSMTLSAFADMGWYQVSYARAQRLPWGNGLGCSFVLQTCQNWPSSYFCTVPSQGGCTVDMRYRGSCNAFTAPYTLPSQYQYFPGQPSLGGENGYLDYCPVYWRLSDGDCSSTSTLGLWFYGEQPGPNALCFRGTYQRSSLTNTPAQHAGCLQSTCNVAATLVATLPQSSGSPLVVTCPIAGGVIDLGTISGSSYVGTLICPPSNVVCTGNPCDRNTCSNHGSCNPGDGTCNCNLGYYGTTRFDCSQRYCPLGLSAAGNRTQCAGNALCDSNSGICLDESGQPGCNLGWTNGPNGQCSARGCPSRVSPGCGNSTSCPCSGYGVCDGVTGTCTCVPGRIGNDCFQTDCPGSPRCGGSSAGVCDTSRGVCVCSVGRIGQACEAFYVGGSVPSTRLYFIGEDDPITLMTGAPYSGVLRAKQYTYFSFPVATTQFPLYLKLAVSAAATLNTSLPPTLIANETYNASSYIYPEGLRAYYSSAGSGPLQDQPARPLLVASFLSQGIPTAQSLQFPSIPSDALGLSLGINFVPGADGAFTQSGTILAAALVSIDSFVTVNLTRDGCALLNCSNGGVCLNGQCQCARFPVVASIPTPTYGWSGLTCDTPDCPSGCSGRGTCTVTVGVARPYCVCNSVYAGVSCERYNLTDTAVLGIIGADNDTPEIDRSGFHALRFVTGQDAQGNFTYTTAGLWNQSFAGKSVDSGQYDNAVLIDPNALSRCCGMNDTLAVYARLQDTTASGLADPALLSGVNYPPTLATYSTIDLGSWQSRGSVHELAFLTQGRNLGFVTVVNGRYSQDRLTYTLYIEVTSGGVCPPAMANCSGHGTCVGVSCTCNAGWEGLTCSVPAPVLTNATTVVSPSLAPGDWVFWVYPVSDSPSVTVEIDLSMSQVMGGAQSLPLLTAFFDSARSANSLAGLQSEHALFDFAGYASQAQVGSAVAQHISALRNNPGSQRVLYVGVSNNIQARASVTVSVSLVATTESSTCDLSSPVSCRQSFCSGRGDLTVASGRQYCSCDVGWNPSNKCAGPLFAKFDTLVAAAQSISYLCSVCAHGSIPLDRSEMSLYKVPQPLQASTGLGVTVGPAHGAMRTLEDSRRSLQASTSSAGNATSPFVGILGTPSLLISTRLPRSIVDFIYIASGPSFNESIVVTNSSPSGEYFIAVYAATPGEFKVQASRVIYPVNIPAGPSFIDQLRAWITGSTLGIAIIAAGGGLLLCVCLGCCLQQCGPSCNSKLAEKLLEEEKIEERTSQFLRSVRHLHLSSTGTRAPSVAHSIGNMSSRFLSIIQQHPDEAAASHRQVMASSKQLTPRGGQPLRQGTGVSLRHMHVQLAAAASHASLARSLVSPRGSARGFQGVNPMVTAVNAQQQQQQQQARTRVAGKHKPQAMPGPHEQGGLYQPMQHPATYPGPAGSGGWEGSPVSHTVDDEFMPPPAGYY